LSLTIALTRTSEKKAHLIKAGTAHVIATEEVDLVGEVMRIANGRGRASQRREAIVA
jgi:NADPH:quinone reductase-like Zn-dependent oxidoreductase